VAGAATTCREPDELAQASHVLPLVVHYGLMYSQGMRWGRRRRLVNAVQRHTRGAPVPQRAHTLLSKHIQLIIDHAEFVCMQRRGTTDAELWEECLRIQWSAVRRIAFATDIHDPIVALYVWTAPRERHYVADSGFLTQSQWTRLAGLIAQSTGGRLTLDLAGRDNPRSMSPDW
jgi:hypothetical protein